jgi:hypothetical protein
VVVASECLQTCLNLFRYVLSLIPELFSGLLNNLKLLIDLLHFLLQGLACLCVSFVCVAHRGQHLIVNHLEFWRFIGFLERVKHLLEVVFRD